MPGYAHTLAAGRDGEAPSADDLPASVLYAIAAPVGGHGLGRTAAESLRASIDRGILGGVVGVSVDRSVTGKVPAKDLRWHPARALRPFLRSDDSMGARKQVVAATAARWLRGGRFDFFHGWSGEAMRPMIEARRRGIPCVLDIPTWHRDKGEPRPFYTKADRGRKPGRLEITRQQVLTEYALADLILVQSEAAAESFLRCGVPPGKVFLLGRGVDPDRFQPANRPDLFRLVFLGTLCRRKGVHLLVEAWKRLNLKNAELVLVGGVDADVAELLRDPPAGVVVPGFADRPQDWLERASAFVLPSSLEGAAKAVYEAAACALPLIATRESGDVVVDGVNGIVVPPDDADALAAAIKRLYDDPATAAAMGKASRRRVEEHLTWDHHRKRLLHAYAAARRMVGVSSRRL